MTELFQYLTSIGFPPSLLIPLIMWLSHEKRLLKLEAQKLTKPTS
ncbi:hypothetical protein VRK_06320 [Vibrio sp. MEBiC08052]|nr:hypothetical protein VRK_06320 [Vibrio sp. MEBiC08052]